MKYLLTLQLRRGRAADIATSVMHQVQTRKIKFLNFISRPAVPLSCLLFTLVCKIIINYLVICLSCIEVFYLIAFLNHLNFHILDNYGQPNQNEVLFPFFYKV